MYAVHVYAALEEQKIYIQCQDDCIDHKVSPIINEVCIIFICHYYQVYLQLRFGPTESANHLGSILEAVDRVKAFSMKMRTFMRDVINCGLQRQYESVCENIGLMAFVLQSETGGPNSH